MYSLVRKALFQFSPEISHEISMDSLDALYHLGILGMVSPAPISAPKTIMGISFPNSVGLAAGLDKNGEHIGALSALGFGFIEVGTVTPRPQPGNPKPRLFRLPQANAIINRMGFNNKGVDYLLAQVKRSNFDGVLGINIGKNKDTPNENAVDDYLYCLERVYDYADYITVNISSPNTQGLRDLQGEQALRSFVQEGGKRTLYQEGPLSKIRDPRELIFAWKDNKRLPMGNVMFCGTMPAIGDEGVSPDRVASAVRLLVRGVEPAQPEP